MTFASPWALIGLLAVPILWWLHRRRSRPPAVTVPSLLFLDEETSDEASCRRRFDPELWIAIFAASLLALAAAGPSWRTREAGRRIRVVVSGGAPASARGYRDHVRARLASLRNRLGPADRMDVTVEPPPGDTQAPRPAPGELLAAALAAEASTRIVLSDRPPPAETGGVEWVQVGNAAWQNVGLVAAQLVPGEAGLEVFATAQADGEGDADLRLVLLDESGTDVLAEVPLRVPAGGYAGAALPLPAERTGFTLALRAKDGAPVADDLQDDDRVVGTRTPLRWRVDAALPEPYRQAVERALAAALGALPAARATGPCDLEIRATGTPPGPYPATVRLVLHPIPPGQAGARVGEGSERRRPDALIRDLHAAGSDLRFAPEALTFDRAGEWLLWREAGGVRAPVVARLAGDVHFLPDPLQGAPSPAGTTLWPLFVDNTLRMALGSPSTAAPGWRLRGVLDAASSRLGRVADPELTTAQLGGARDRPPRDLPLAPWLLIGAVLALLALWLLPWERPPPIASSAPGRTPVPSSS